MFKSLGIACAVLAATTTTGTVAAPCPHAVAAAANNDAVWSYPGSAYELTDANRSPAPAPVTPDVEIARAMGDSIPYPFTRELAHGDEGNDVYVLQNLLARFTNVPTPDGKFGTLTAAAVKLFQVMHSSTLTPTGKLDFATARIVLSVLSLDDWRDDRKNAAAPAGWKYKVWVPQPARRAQEVRALLLDANHKILHSFQVRLHGHSTVGKEDWPTFDSEPGLNAFTSNGNTPSGLARIDLNEAFAPEYQHLYGPYPVNRIVEGLEGNMGFLVPRVRNGILIHTGAWSNATGWNEAFDMPNSAGCIHVHPADAAKIAEILISIGVQVRPNHGGKVPYPYEPQGVLAVEEYGEKLFVKSAYRYRN